MNNSPPGNQHLTPSQILAANRSHDTAAEHEHRTPSQIVRDNGLMPHAHAAGHDREPVQVADGPRAGQSWLEWVKEREGTGGTDQNERFKARILPNEQREQEQEKDKDRER